MKALVSVDDRSWERSAPLLVALGLHQLAVDIAAVAQSEQVTETADTESPLDLVLLGVLALDGHLSGLADVDPAAPTPAPRFDDDGWIWR